MNLVFAGRGRSQGQNLFIPEKRRSFNIGDKNEDTGETSRWQITFSSKDRSNIQSSFVLYWNTLEIVKRCVGNQNRLERQFASCVGSKIKLDHVPIRYDPYGSPERKDGPPLFSGEHRPILSAGVAFFLPGRLPSSYPDASELVKSRAACLFLFSCPRPWF